MNIDLSGKVAIVTGARQGIGKGIALELAKSKAKVVVADLVKEDCEKVVSEIKKLGGEGLAVKCDVSSKKDVDAMISDTLKKFKKIDILVNNAGIYPFKPFLEMTEAEWDKVMSINLKSVFLCSQAAAKVMKEGGRIVSITSIASLVGFPSLVHYCASKGGISAFTRALAMELVSKRINVNAIAPGAVETPGTGKFGPEMLAAIPSKTAGLPEDIAWLACFLVSDEARNITGQVFVSDGGWTAQ